jgi:hypothetical protein
MYYKAMINEQKREILKKMVCNSDGVGGKGYKSSKALRNTPYYKKMKAMKKISKGPVTAYTKKLKEIASLERVRKTVRI